MVARRPTLAVLALCASLAGCRKPASTTEPPLRPLLYTEPIASDEPLPGDEMWTRPDLDPVAWPTAWGTHSAAHMPRPRGPAATSNAEQLLVDVVDALLTNDDARFLAHVLDAEGLRDAARMGQDAARVRAAELADEAEETLARFDPGPAAAARPGGLGALLEPTQVVAGRPRLVDGQLVEDPADAELRWGSEVTLQLVGHDQTFTVRFPQLLRRADGTWALGAAPTVDARFATWRRLGMDRKPELMDAEHAAWPLTAGSYWHYRVRQPTADALDEDGEQYGVLTDDGYRDEVVDVSRWDGWRLVRLRRLFDDPSRSSESPALLVTPLHVYDCPRDCIRNADDVGWILAWSERRTPLLVDGVEAGRSWGAGGTDVRNNVYRSSPDPEEAAVPAGTFRTAVEISRSTPGGREARYFAHGIGVVMTRQVAGITTTVEELVDYRILP